MANLNNLDPKPNPDDPAPELPAWVWVVSFLICAAALILGGVH